MERNDSIIEQLVELGMVEYHRASKSDNPFTTISRIPPGAVTPILRAVAAMIAASNQSLPPLRSLPGLDPENSSGPDSE